jgi:hypothetical protein
MPTPESLLGRISKAAMVILLVAVVVNLGWRLIKPIVPAVVVLTALCLLFRYVLHQR